MPAVRPKEEIIPLVYCERRNIDFSSSSSFFWRGIALFLMVFPSASHMERAAFKMNSLFL